MDFDVEGMCNPRGDWTRINMVMENWEKTHSKAVYWSNQISL